MIITNIIIITINIITIITIFINPFSQVNSLLFACRPEVSVAVPRVFAHRGENATLECEVLGNLVPGVKWVLNGRVIQNNTSPLKCNNCGRVYIINTVATSEREAPPNFLLTL